MSDAFDPYYEWLGIPPDEQPPNHYRLLELEKFESDRNLIAKATEEKMEHIRTFQLGENFSFSQKLLGEIATARVCLLNAEKKAAYDQHLRGESAVAEERAAVAPPALDTVSENPSTPFPDFTFVDQASPDGITPQSSAFRRALGRKKKKNLPLKIALAIGSAAMVVLLLLLVTGGGEEEKNPAAGNEPTKTTFLGTADADPQGLVVPKLDVPNLTELPAKGRQAASEPLQTTATPAEQEPPREPEPSQNAASETAETAVPADADQQARDLLEGKGLRESFNEWELFELTESYQTATDGQAAGGPTAAFESELQQRIEARRRKLTERFQWLQTQQPDNGGPLDQEYNKLVGILQNFGPEADRIRSELQSELATPTPAGTSDAQITIVKQLRDSYALLAKDPEVQAALEQVDGELAEPPDLPAIAATAGRERAENQTALVSTESPPAASDDQQEEVQQGSDPQAQNDSQPPEPEAAGQPSTAGKESGGGSPAESESPAATFNDLKDQLTAAQKQTVIAFTKFNKGVKEYTKGQKELLKRIKPLQGLIARLQAQLDAMPDGDKKNAFGTQIEDGPMKNLEKLQGKLAGLPKPDAAVVEAEFAAADKLVEQLQELPQYESNRSSITALAEKIEKTKKAFGGAQRKLAKEPK